MTTSPTSHINSTGMAQGTEPIELTTGESHTIVSENEQGARLQNTQSMRDASWFQRSIEILPGALENFTLSPPPATPSSIYWGPSETGPHMGRPLHSEETQIL